MGKHTTATPYSIKGLFLGHLREEESLVKTANFRHPKGNAVLIESRLFFAPLAICTFAHVNRLMFSDQRCFLTRDDLLRPSKRV